MSTITITGSIMELDGVETQRARVTATPTNLSNQIDLRLGRLSWRLPLPEGQQVQLPAGAWRIKISPTGSGDHYFDAIEGTVTLTSDLTWRQLATLLLDDLSGSPLAELLANDAERAQQVHTLTDALAALQTDLGTAVTGVHDDLDAQVLSLTAALNALGEHLNALQVGVDDASTLHTDVANLHSNVDDLRDRLAGIEVFSVVDNGDGTVTITASDTPPPVITPVVTRVNTDGSVSYAGAGVTNHGDGTFTLTGPNVFDNADGTYTVA